MQPLMKNTGKAPPNSRAPNEKLQPARNTVASESRQKFASVPPIVRAVRVAETADSENKIVASRAGSICAVVGMRRVGRCHASISR